MVNPITVAQPSTSAMSNLGRMTVSPSLNNPARGLFSPPPLMPISRPAGRNVARRGAARTSGTGRDIANVRSSRPPSRGAMPGERGRFDGSRRRGTPSDTLFRLRWRLDRMEGDWRCYRRFLDILERHYNQLYYNQVQYLGLSAMGTTLRNWLLDMAGWPQNQYQPRHRTPPMTARAPPFVPSPVPSAPSENLISDSSEEIESDSDQDSEVSLRKRRWQEERKRRVCRPRHTTVARFVFFIIVVLTAKIKYVQRKYLPESSFFMKNLTP